MITGASTWNQLGTTEQVGDQYGVSAVDLSLGTNPLSLYVTMGVANALANFVLHAAWLKP